MHYGKSVRRLCWLNFTTVLNSRPADLGQVATKREETISLEGDQLVAIRLLEPVVSFSTSAPRHHRAPEDEAPLTHPIFLSFLPPTEKCTVRLGALRFGGGLCVGRKP